MKKQIPTFETEKEEAEWWDAHQEEHQEAILESIRQGRAITLEQAFERNRPRSTASVPMDSDDLELAQEQARAKGIEYEAYLKMLIHEGLRNEAARDAKAS